MLAGKQVELVSDLIQAAGKSLSAADRRADGIPVALSEHGADSKPFEQQQPGMSALVLIAEDAQAEATPMLALGR